MKVIGVLGGMGPESTGQFYLDLIRQCQLQYGASKDEDYPEIFIYTLPIPDIVTGLDNSDRTLSLLVKGAKRLEATDIEVLVMPCNTAHYFYDMMQKELDVPFLNLLEETKKKVISLGYKNVGLLATDTTVKHKLYHKTFEDADVNLILPENQDAVTALILKILSREADTAEHDLLKNMANSLAAAGADAVILGCTDLPLVMEKDGADIPLLDTLDILAEATIKYALK